LNRGTGHVEHTERHTGDAAATLAAASALGRSLLTGANSAGSLATLGTDLDSTRLVGHVENAITDLVIDVLGGLLEGLLHIGGSLGGGLQEKETVVLGKLLTLLLGHSPPRLKITGERAGGG